MKIPLNNNREEILKKLRQITQTKFVERAAKYEEQSIFPKENFVDLFEAELNAPTVDQLYGGLGLGHHHGDILTLWLMTKEIAKADMAMARCWEGHANAMVLINYLATKTQKEKWFNGVVKEGDIWSVWSGEPLARAPHENQKFGTSLTKVKGGYLLSGTKVFCSSSVGADWAILLVNEHGSGGARHAGSLALSVQMLVCDLSDSSVTFDDSWWNPMGMKASVSYMVRFDNTFIPDENALGGLGAYISGEWQTRFSPHYTATFLGGMEAAYDATLQYILQQKKEKDPYIQHRIGKMAIHIQTARFWLEHVANLWENAQDDEAKAAGNCARYIIEQGAKEVIQHAIHACGARSLFKPNLIERVYRDLSFYTRHDNDDQVLAMIGKSIFGMDHDKSFFNPENVQKKKAI